MSILTNVKLAMLFLLLTVFLTVVVLLQSAVIIADNLEISGQATYVAENKIPILNKAHRAKLAVVQVQQWLTDISATRARDGLNDGFDEAENNAKVFRGLVSDLIALDSANAEAYRAMLPVFDAYYDVGRKMAQSYIDEGPAGGNKMMAQFDEVAAKMAYEVDGFLSRVEEETNTALSIQQELATSTERSVIIGSLVVLLGVGLVYLIMSRALAYLPRVVAEMQRVSEGDLTSSIDVTRRDEIGDLMRGLQSMQKRLLAMISHINATAAQLSTTAEKMSVVTTQTSTNIHQQQSDTEQIATAMNEMSATVNEVAQSVSNTSAVANSANTETEKGRKVVEQAVLGVQQLAGQIDNAANVIAEVGKDSENINTVLVVIKGIAEQTNLLALNAAIEAARAGEQGRGFAVVADEVRTLAGRTQESTEEINQIIEKLQSGARSAIEAMDLSRRQTKSVVDQAALAGSALTTIAASVSQINEMSTQIATAAKEQNAVAEDVNRNIARISEIARQSASGAEQASQSGQNLTQLALELQRLVGQFQMERAEVNFRMS